MTARPQKGPGLSHARGYAIMMSSNVLHTSIMAKRKKYEPILVKLKPLWKAAKGHPAPCPGAGTHRDSRTQRKRTRNAANRAAIEDQS